MLAGHETTAAALAWTFERLTRNPALLKRTAQAAANSDDAWLDAVCKESNPYWPRERRIQPDGCHTDAGERRHTNESSGV